MRQASGDQRAQSVAALGFALQLASYGVLLGVALAYKSDAIRATSMFVLVGLPIWLVLFLIFKQMRRVAGEALETAELRKAREAGASTALFEMEDETLLLERQRFQWMVRWLLPTATVVIAVGLLLHELAGWSWSFQTAFAKDGLRRTLQPTLVMWIVIGVGFLCFLYARYATGLARLSEWRLLNAGAACMAGNALACLLLAIALMTGSTLTWAEPLVAYIVRIGLLVLAAEFVVNFILDLYRPRIPGEIARPSFESRLLELVSQPGSLAKSIADAVNYQFGFEVSSTWFYKLLQRWLAPIMVLSMIVVLALTCVVIVDAEEQALVERLGRPVRDVGEPLSPGIHFKLPYPIDTVYRAPVKKVSELVIGEAAEPDDGDSTKAILWTEKHDYVPELMLLVAAPKSTEPTEAPSPQEKSGPATAGASVAVGLLMVSLPIEYRIKDVKKYLYTYDDPVKLMEDVAYQVLTEYAAGTDIDALLGPGREAFNAKLAGLIQTRLDELDVGVEVVLAGIRGAHPPSAEQVAEAFQSVVSAQTNMAGTIHAAEGAAQRILIAVAGTQARAKSLDEAIVARDSLQAAPGGDPQRLGEAESRISDLILGDPSTGLAPMSGRAAAVIADARAAASEQVSQARTKARAFGTEVAAYTAAPAIYKHRKILDIYTGLGHVRKYLIVGDSSNVIIEYNTEEEAGLDRVLQEGVAEERKKRDER